MKKLIKLLNEWLKYKEKFGPDKLTRVAGIDNSGELLFELENGCYWNVEYIISKKAEFIKRLVDNDKIDDKKLYSNDYRLMIKLEGESYGELGGADRLIMILSIKDNPIEFLISVLK